MSVPAGMNTLANDLTLLWEVKLKDVGAEMAECLLTSVGGCLGLGGLPWPGWLNPYNWSGHRAVKPMTEELSVPEDPSG